MPTRRNTQLARIFGIRIGVSASWFFVLFVLIYWLSNSYFPEIMSGSQTTAYAIAVAGALGYFASLVLHELGHALMARRLGIEVAGIDLWAFGGLSRMRREPAQRRRGVQDRRGRAPGHARAVRALPRRRHPAGQRAGTSPTWRSPTGALTTTPALALLGWLGFINAVAVRVQPRARVPARRRADRARDRSGGAPATATARHGHRPLRPGVRADASALLGLWVLATGDSLLGLLTMLLAFFLYQAAGAAVVQGTLGRAHPGHHRRRHHGPRARHDRPPQSTLLDAQEQFFLRYRWPWFAVVDPAGHFLGVVRQQRVESEIAAGRPALAVVDVLEEDMPVRIDEAAPLESLLGSEGLGRLGAMVAVDERRRAAGRRHARAGAPGAALRHEPAGAHGRRRRA